jgi:competence protein ComEA
MNNNPEKQEPVSPSWVHFTYAVLIGLSVGGLILLLSRKPSPTPIQILPTTTNEPFVVYITGEVNQPGVYELKQEVRIYELIDLAGGLTDDADISKLNLASYLRDGQKVTVPSYLASTAEVLAEFNNSANPQEVEITYPININLCSVEELITLPGIGETKAQAIIDYREKNGAFEVIEDILLVHGIGESIFETIKDKITVK